MVSGIHTNVVSPENHRLCLQTDFLPAAQIKRKMTCICNPILIQICTSKMIRICSHLDTDLLSISEAFSSGHTKIVDFAHFYWFGRFLLISTAHGPNLLISSAHGRGRPPCAPWYQDFCHGRPRGWSKCIDFKSIFIDLGQKYWYEINTFCRLWAPMAVGTWNQKIWPVGDWNQ